MRVDGGFHRQVALVAFFLGGIANGVENVSMRSLIHHRVPDELRGRVFAAQEPGAC